MFEREAHTEAEVTTSVDMPGAVAGGGGGSGVPQKVLPSVQGFKACSSLLLKFLIILF